MPTQIATTPDDTRTTGLDPCAHVYGAPPTPTWLYKAKTEPEPPSHAHQLRSSGRRLGGKVAHAQEEALDSGLGVARRPSWGDRDSGCRVRSAESRRRGARRPHRRRVLAWRGSPRGAGRRRDRTRGKAPTASARRAGTRRSRRRRRFVRRRPGGPPGRAAARTSRRTRSRAAAPSHRRAPRHARTTPACTGRRAMAHRAPAVLRRARAGSCHSGRAPPDTGRYIRQRSFSKKHLQIGIF